MNSTWESNSNIIEFAETVSTYVIYNDILKKFLNIYKSRKKEIPILDLRKTTYISPAAVPVLLSFGDYLRRLYRKPISLYVSKESNLLNFLISSRFIYIGKELGIFNMDQTILDSWKYKELRDMHKVSYTNTHYSDTDMISDLIQRRNYIFDCLLDRTKVVYKSILNDTNQLPEYIIDATINSIAEIETNAIMYSTSYSFTYVASDKFGTQISIADSGVGFEKSFENQKRELTLLKKFKRIEPKFRNFLVIMSAMNYSYLKHIDEDREDLWTLKTNIVNSNGVFKVHYRNTQVIFSNSRCKGCKKLVGEKDISRCVRCLLEDYNTEQFSPIKLFEVGFQGVRIEVQINRGE